jgi:hypothetical protein
MISALKPAGLCLALALVAGTVAAGHAQEADEVADLRLETSSDEDLLQPEPQRQVEDRLPEEEAPALRRRRETVDPYAAQGLSAGAFRLFPSLELSSELSTNPRRSLPRSGVDLGLRLRPELRFESDWVRHSLTGSVAIEAETFLENEDLRSVAGNLEAGLRLDVRRTTTADITWSYDATSTAIGDSELPATATGSRLDHQLAGSVAVTHDFGSLEGRFRLGASHRWFGEVELSGGGNEDNSDRNVTELSVAARGTLLTGGKIQPFAEVAYEPRIFDKKQDRNGLKRNSQGLRLSAGVSIDDDPIWSGDLAATLELRDYSDNSLNTVLSPGIAANLTWRPTDLTRFEFNAGASISDTVSAGISASKEWTIGYAMAHALRENVDLVSGLTAEFENEAGATDITLTSNVGIEWTLNPFVVLSAGYEGTFFRGAGAADDYTDHRLLTSIVLRR